MPSWHLACRHLTDKTEGGYKMAQLTQKELMYISDCMEKEQNEMKKFSDYANQVTDPSLSSTLQGIAQMHQSHFGILKSHLDSAASSN